MDNSVDAEKSPEVLALERKLGALVGYRDSQITQEVFRTLDDAADDLINMILERPVTNIETFLAREQALGHLRGLRAPKAIVAGEIEEIEQKLKAI